MAKKLLIILFFLMPIHCLTSQSDVDRLVETLLGDTPLEEDLMELCDNIGGRVTGSVQNEMAVDWAYEKFDESNVSVSKDAFEMPLYWNEINTAATIVGLHFQPSLVAKYQTPPGTYDYPIIWLGKGSEQDFQQYSALELQSSFIMVETDLCLDIDGLFEEYAHATRVEIEAYKNKVRGIIFMSSRPKKLLYHFLTMKTVDNRLAQFIMAREDAQRCARLLQDGYPLRIQVNSDIDVGDGFISHNVIGEIQGSDYPEQVIVIGSHIDSWALGTGANDNGCNVSLIIDIARQMRKLGLVPKRTIRFALWNGEEQGYYGSWDYTKRHLDDLDMHKMALSVDIGSGAITGFFTNGREELIDIVSEVLKPVTELGEFHQFNSPIIGTDNFDFMLQGVPNLVAIHTPQVYGPNYHASSDTFDKVDLKQLKVNSAIVASLTLGFANLSEEKMSILTRHKRKQIQNMINTFELEFPMKMFNVWNPWVDLKRGRIDE